LVHPLERYARPGPVRQTPQVFGDWSLLNAFIDGVVGFVDSADVNVPKGVARDRRILGRSPLIGSV
jgi:hypothetical protein